MNGEDNIFLARVRDLSKKAENGMPAYTAFLTPEEQAIAKKCLEYEYPELKFAFYGGYDGAERQVLVIFPDYMEEQYFSTDECFDALLIDNGGYSALSHSACLGALMNCSLARSAIGDICLISRFEAIVFITKNAAKLLLSENALTRVGREKVKVRLAEKELTAAIKREFEELSVTVASDRLDCLVSQIAKSSREGAQRLIASGAVSKNHITELAPAQRLFEGDTVSVRGEGKFVIDTLSPTKKGRVRVQMRRYK